MKTSYDPDERWRELKEMPEHRFESRLARDVITGAESWNLPAPYACIVRVDDIENGKVTEKAFKNHEAAWKYIEQLDNKDLAYCVYDANEIFCSPAMVNYNEAESGD
jgi:hypothetical protein